MAISVGIIVAIAAAAALYFAFAKQGDHSSLASNVSTTGSITIVTISEGSFVPGATYRITSLSPSNSSTLIVSGKSTGDSNAADGIIQIARIDNGNYSVAQIGMPSGYQLDTTPRFVQVSGKPVAIAFSNPPSSSLTSQAISQPRSVTYTAKFECGTITGSEGPLRPGHYDTDVSMLNKQDFPVKILWSASVIHGSSTNTVLQNLDPREATRIVCKDLTNLLGMSGEFTEGFVFIEAPLDAQTLGQLATNGAMVVSHQQNLTDLLDVQAFYTANALDVLPHEVYVDKISFTIINDTTGKISASLLGKKLDITVASNVSMITDPEAQVRRALADKYNLTPHEADSVQIKVDSVDVAVSAMIDDHAISLSRVPPQPTG